MVVVCELRIEDADRNGRYKGLWVKSNWERIGVGVIAEGGDAEGKKDSRVSLNTEFVEQRWFF